MNSTFSIDSYKEHIVRYEILTAVLMKTPVFCHVMPC